MTHGLLDHPPEYDELLHVLAAQGINDSGEPRIADGEYPRARLFTQIVALLPDGGGKSELIIARLPALIAGALLVALLGAWVSLNNGILAGLATAATLAILPDTVHLSVLVRFYTLHALLMVCMLILIFEALSPGRTALSIIILCALSALSFAIGFQLQVLSQVTALAGVSASIAVLMYDHRQTLLSLGKKNPTSVLLLLISLLIIVSILVYKLNVYEKLRGVTPAWSVSKANDIFFYIKSYTSRFPLLWPLFPVFLVVGFFSNRRMTLFFAIVVFVSLAISSIASQKATRYAYHLAPSIAVIYGIGLSAAFKHLSEYLGSKLSVSFSYSRIIALVIMTVCLVNSVEIQRALKLVTGKGTLDRTIPVMSEPDWALAATELSDYLETATHVVVTSGVKSLYNYGRYDFELSKTVVGDTITKTEFGFDARTGKTVISTPESMDRILAMGGSTLVILENRMLNKSYSAPTETVTNITSNCTLINIPIESQLTAWICN